MRLGDIEAGTKVSGLVPIAGTDVHLPVTLIAGKQAGHTCLISGGVHSAEYVGIQAAMEVADEIRPEELAGNLIVIRLMNPGYIHLDLDNGTWDRTSRPNKARVGAKTDDAWKAQVLFKYRF